MKTLLNAFFTLISPLLPKQKVYYDKEGNPYHSKEAAERPFGYHETVVVNDAAMDWLREQYSHSPRFYEHELWENSQGCGPIYDYKKKRAVFKVYYIKGEEMSSPAKHFFNRPRLTEFTYEFEGKTLPAVFEYEYRGKARIC